MIVQSQLRLLVLTSLLLCATLVLPGDRQPGGSFDNVFEQPPAYLHPRTALNFDLSGLSGRNPTEAELMAATHARLDPEARAHAHFSLAVYYKSRGLTGQAELEKRKGEYWRRIARLVPTDTTTE